jgi:hypothetical protein
MLKSKARMSARSISSLALALLVFGAGSARAEGLSPLWLGTEDMKVRPSMVLQLQATGTLNEEGVATDAFIRRTRLLLSSSALEGRIKTRIHVEVTPQNPELIDLWVDGKVTDLLTVRVGQFKTPFTQYYQYPLTQLAVDWPTVSKWYGGERQLGVQTSGKLPWGFGYASGVFAGQNRRAAFSKQLATLYGEKVSNPSSWTALRDGPELDALHPELMLRIFHAHEDMTTGYPIDREGVGLRHWVGASFAWDTMAVKRRDWAMRFAPEAIVKWQGFSLHTVTYFAMFRDRLDQLLPGSVGGIVELGWRPHRLLELTARADRAQVLPALDNDAKRSGTSSGLVAQTEVTGGIHILLLGRNLVWQNDLGLLRDDKRSSSSASWKLRSQLQVTF